MNGTDPREMASAHETQPRSSSMALEEELAMHEATLQTLLRRQQDLDVEKAHRQRQEHLNNLEALKLRRETLEQARRKHLSLQQVIEEALKKSHERLARAVAASIHVDDPNAVSAEDDDDVVDNENIEESDVDATESSPPTERQVQIPVPQLHRNQTIMHDFWNASSSSHGGLVVFLPCLNSVDLIQRVMNVTALETLALDISHPDHRLESVKKTCLDFFCTASKRMEEGIEQVPETEENKQGGAIDPNVALCPYELAGVCADAFCPFQHIRPRTMPNLAWELLPLPKLKLPETPGDERMEEPPKKRPRTLEDGGSHQTVELSDEIKEKDDGSNQTFNPSDKGTEKAEAGNQTVDPYDAGMEEAESGSKADRLATMEWNDDFVSLPPVFKAADEDDSVSSDGSAGQAKVSGPVAANLDNYGDASVPTLWWLTDADISRIKDHPGTLSTLQLSLTDWLELVGGFQIKQMSDENAAVLTFGGYPTLPREAISIVGRVVDCVRLSVHAGRFCLAHALCEFAQRSLNEVFTDSDISEAESDVGNVLVKAVEYLVKERDRAFTFNSDSKATFYCAFEVQVSMAALAKSLRLLYEQQTDDQSGPCDNGLEELFVLFMSTSTSSHLNMATRTAKYETTSRKRQTGEYTFLELFTRDETNKDHNSSTNVNTRLHLGTPSSIVLLGQSLMASAANSTMNSLVDDMLKPALSDLQLLADESNKEGQCMAALVIMGYVILGCAQSVCSHVRGDLGVGLSATLTPIDSFIHKIVNSLTSFASTEPLAELILAPLYALSVSLASTLRRYGKAQHRVEVALNGVLATRRINGGYMIYSELLWSQLIQLQCSLPHENYQLAATAGHERIARLVHAFGVHPNHVTLSGDWNMHKEPVRHELCERVYFGGEPLVCALTEIQMPAPLSVASLVFPRSVLLVGPHLSALAARNCHLQELPVTFGLHFPNLKILDLGYNRLTELPESIGKLQSLVMLNVSHNNLRVLSVGSLKKLAKLYATNNELTALPNIMECKSLEELDLSHNPIQNLPSELPLRLANLWKLRVDKAADLFVHDQPPKLPIPPATEQKTLACADLNCRGVKGVTEMEQQDDYSPKLQKSGPETLACVDCQDVNGKNETEQHDSRKLQSGPETTLAHLDCHSVTGTETEAAPKSPAAPPKPLAYASCIDCGARNGKEGFFKSQWKLREKGRARCKPCWESHRASERTPSPRKKRAVAAAAAAAAAAVESKSRDPPETLACMDCRVVKDKEGFYRNQWKLRDPKGTAAVAVAARCKPCWDHHLLLDPPKCKPPQRPMQEEYDRGSNKNVVVEAMTTTKKQQQQRLGGDMVERTCTRCFQLFVTPKRSKNKTAKECNSCATLTAGAVG